MNSSRKSRSLEEARFGDVGDEPPTEAPPAEATPEPPEDLSEPGHWCLFCTEPGVIGPDPCGNYYCEKCAAERDARMAANLAARTRRRRPFDPQPPSAKAIGPILDRLGQHLRPMSEQRSPYRD